MPAFKKILSVIETLRSLFVCFKTTSCFLLAKTCIGIEIRVKCGRMGHMVKMRCPKGTKVDSTFFFVYNDFNNPEVLGFIDMSHCAWPLSEFLMFMVQRERARIFNVET